MTGLADLYASQPLWTWLAVGGVLLGIEVLTGSGWLLWPAASAAAVALLTLTGWPPGPGGAVVLFSVLTIATTLLARRFAPGWSRPEGRDINDSDLTGRVGHVAAAFIDGEGRVLVSGAEWAAQLDGGGSLGAGSKISVLRVEDGVLRVARLS